MANKNEYMRIRIPIDPPAPKKIKVQKIKENEDVEEIGPTYPPEGNILEEVDAKFVWHENSPGCVTFSIFGIHFEV